MPVGGNEQGLKWTGAVVPPTCSEGVVHGWVGQLGAQGLLVALHAAQVGGAWQ
jgi:hypothetical protein